LTDVATEHEKHALIKDDVVTNSNVGPLKKNREEKRYFLNSIKGFVSWRGLPSLLMDGSA
jgi:hypothetical protein